MEAPYAFIPCIQFPSLQVVKTIDGKYFVGAKSAVQLMTGHSSDSVGVKLTNFIKEHYSHVHTFPSIAESDDSTHLCWYKSASGQKAYAFSVAGLEYLCARITGAAASENRFKFMELIQEFKRSLPHKRPHASSGDDTPDPKRAANDLVNPLTTKGDDGMLPVAMVKQALIAHSAMISDEVVKAVEPFHQAVVSSQQQMYQGNQELRDEVCKIEMKAETLVENTSTIARGIMTETVANRDKISRMEYQLARLNQVIREKDAQIERLNLQLDDDLRTVSDNVVTLNREMKEIKAEINGFKTRFDSIDAGLKTLVDLLLPGA